MYVYMLSPYVFFLIGFSKIGCSPQSLPPNRLSDNVIAREWNDRSNLTTYEKYRDCHAPFSRSQ